MTGGGGKITQDLGVSYDQTQENADPGLTTQFLRKDGVYAIPPGGGGGSVSSVFGRDGAVTGETGDYAADQIGATVPGTAAAASLPLLYGGVWGYPWQFLPESYGAKGDVQVGLCSVSDGEATVTVTTGTVSSTDVGKNVMICGALGTPGGPWIDTVSSVDTGANQWTLSTAGAAVTQAGLAVVWSSDDRLAIDACLTALGAYALAGSYEGEMLLTAPGYGLGTGLFQSEAGAGGALLTYNTQVRVPVPAGSGVTQKLETRIRSLADNGHEQFWMSQIPNLGAGALVSYSIGPDDNPDATYGQQSIIGGPIGGSVADADYFFNTKVVLDGVQTWQPGWSNSIGAQLHKMTGCRVKGGGSFAWAPATDDGGGVNPYGGWPAESYWQEHKIGAGLQLPGAGNNQDTLVESFAVGGLPFGLMTDADGPVINRLIAVSCGTAVKLGEATSGDHDLVIGHLYHENCNNGIDASDVSSGPVVVHITADSEAFTGVGYDVNDGNSYLGGTIAWNDTQRDPAVPTVNGAANVSIINSNLGPGYWPGAPSVPATTETPSQADMPWRPAWVTITSGGAPVSEIGVDGQATGLTLGDSGAVAVRVPSGKLPALTYDSTAPTWKWWLD